MFNGEPFYLEFGNLECQFILYTNRCIKYIHTFILVKPSQQNAGYHNNKNKFLFFNNLFYANYKEACIVNHLDIVTSVKTMSHCIICNRKETRTCPLLTTTNICVECTDNINRNNSVINEDLTVNDISNTSIRNQCDENNDYIFINASGKQAKITQDDDLVIEQESVFNTNEKFKDALLASLYSQVEFLRNEIEEKTLLIRTLIIKGRRRA